MTRRGLVLFSLAATMALPACRQRVAPPGLSGSDACAAVESLLAVAGPPRPRTMAGHALLDVEQFRFRGRFRLDVTAGGDATIEFDGSTLFGGHREDVVVSLVDDTLRVFDRERGRFYEGTALDELIWDGTRARADWARVMAGVLSTPRRCGEMTGVVLDEGRVQGLEDGDPIRVVLTQQGRVGGATWPNPIVGGTFDDRLEVRYDWRNNAVVEITANLPVRGWRLRLSDDK